MRALKNVGLAAALLLADAPAADHAAAAPPGEVLLAPHRAVYDITLDAARGGVGLSDLSGRMVYELTGSACEGYTQTMRFVTRMTNQEGTTSVNDLRSSSTEEAEGKRFRFSSSQYRDEQLSEQTSGDAERGASGGLRIELTRPKKKEVRLVGKVLFPIQHSIALVAAARAGKSVFASDLYDGSEKGEKVYATTAAIGRRLEPGYNKTLPQVKSAEVLDALPAWPVSLSYFEKTDKSDAAPTYELAFVFFDNGVSRRLFIDYGEFSIRGDLRELTFLDPVKCERKK